MKFSQNSASRCYPRSYQNSRSIHTRIIACHAHTHHRGKGYEADDLIGTIAKQAEKENYKVFMVTPDKDFTTRV
jgi:5'-3' exonuclease